MQLSSLVRTGTTSKWFATNPRPNNAMQTDKVKLSRLLLTQKPRRLAFAADRER
jgi:hypothetical protein